MTISTEEIRKTITGRGLDCVSDVEGLELLARLERAEKERDALRAKVETAENDAAHQKALAASALRVAEGWKRKCGELRAKIAEMERQEPVALVKWQPIETAPRNQAFLAVLNCAGEQTICTMRWPVAEAKNSRTDNKTFHVERVTHWMPLPELPGAQPAPSLASNDVSLISDGKTQPAQSVKDVIIDDLQSQFDTEGITEHDSGDALIRLSDAIAAVEDNFAQPAPIEQDTSVRKAWARFSNELHRSPDAPYPGMSEAFEKHFSQSFTDREWRAESGVWAAAWKAAKNHGAQAQPAPSFADAYQGAMEEVAIWKRRALKAEDLNRKFVAEINGPAYMGEPAQPAPALKSENVSFIDTSQLEGLVSTEIVHSYPPPSGWLRAIDEALGAKGE